MSFMHKLGIILTDITDITCALLFVCSHHLVARVYESKAEFRSALQHEKEGYTIYKNQVSPAGLQGTDCSIYPLWWGDILNISSLYSDGRGTWENQGELRVPEVSHPTGCSSAENHEWDLQERFQRLHHAPQGDWVKTCCFCASICFSFTVQAVTIWFYFLLFFSLLLPAWLVSWNSSTLSTASSLYHSGNLKNLQRLTLCIKFNFCCVLKTKLGIATAVFYLISLTIWRSHPWK